MFLCNMGGAVGGTPTPSRPTTSKQRRNEIYFLSRDLGGFIKAKNSALGGLENLPSELAGARASRLTETISLEAEQTPGLASGCLNAWKETKYADVCKN